MILQGHQLPKRFIQSFLLRNTNRGFPVHGQAQIIIGSLHLMESALGVVSEHKIRRQKICGT